MKFTNLKVLLMAALLSPIALAAQTGTCTIDSNSGNSDTEYSPECFANEDGRQFNKLVLTGKKNIDLIDNPNFMNLAGVTIIFESNINVWFSGDTEIDSTTQFTAPGDKGRIKVDVAGGNYNFNSNGASSVDVLNLQIDDCPAVCYLNTPAKAFVAPVTLLSWNTKAYDDHVALVWETAEEEDNSHFVISRSRDGQNFVHVSTISGQGTTGLNSSYRYTDRKASVGGNYYRLEQYDFDGTRTDLGVQFVTYQEKEAMSFGLSPNPVASGQQITFDETVAEDVDMEIYSPSGSLVGVYRVQGRRFRVPSLVPGVYTIRLQDRMARFVVAR